MSETEMREVIMNMAKECSSYMELYIKAKQYIGAMTYDEFVDYVNMLSEEDSLFKYGEDYSRVTAGIKLGSVYIVHRYDEEARCHK